MEWCHLPGVDLVLPSSCPLIYLFKYQTTREQTRPSYTAVAQSVLWISKKSENRIGPTVSQLKNHQLSSNSDVSNICHFYLSQPPFWNMQEPNICTHFGQGVKNTHGKKVSEQVRLVLSLLFTLHSSYYVNQIVII